MMLTSALLWGLLDASVKSLGLAILAWAGMFVLRVRNDHVRHKVWAFVLVGMLLMPMLSKVVPSLAISVGHISWLTTPNMTGVENVGLPSPTHDPVPLDHRSESAKVVSETVTAIAAQPFSAHPVQPSQAVAQPTVEFSWTGLLAVFPLALAITYLSITAVLTCRLLVGMFVAARMVRGCRPIASINFAAVQCDHVDAPVTFGLLRPKILLPTSWRQWSNEKLQSVLRHERMHIERGDYVVNLLAEMNRCVHWFHPLSWILLRRLADLAEQNCDDAVIAETGQRASYARHLLEIAATSVRRSRLPASASMARSADVESRIEAILDAERPLSHRVSWQRTLALVCVVLPIVWLAAALTPTLAEAIAKTDHNPKRTTAQGTVVSPDGDPVPGAKVRVVYVTRESDSWRRSIQVVGEATTDQAGKFVVEYDLKELTDRRGLAQGIQLPQFLELFALSDKFAVGFPEEGSGLKIAPDKTTRVTLAHPGSLQGRFVDLEGQPIAGVEIEVVSILSASESLDGWFARAAKNPRPVFSFHVMSGRDENQVPPVGFPGHYGAIVRGSLPKVQTAADGTFEIPRIGRDRLVTLRVTSPRISLTMLQMVSRAGPSVYSAFPSVTVRDSRIHGSGSTIALEPGTTIRGRITAADTGQPIVGCDVNVEQIAGSLMNADGFASDTSDVDGNFAIDRLPLDAPDSRGFRIRVTPPDDQPFFPTEYMIRTKGQMETTRNIAMTRARWVTGKVTDAQTGEPVRAMVGYLPMLENKLAEKYDNFVAGVHTVAFSDFQLNREDGTYRVPAIEGRGVLCVAAKHLGRFYHSGGIDRIEGLRREGKPPAIYHLMGESMANEYREVDLGPEDRDPQIDVQVRPLIRNEVEVVDDNNQPILGCYAVGLIPNTPLASRQGLMSHPPLESASVDVLGLDIESPRFVAFYHFERQLGVVVDLQEDDFKGGQTKQVQLLPTGKIRGRVVDKVGKPIAGLRVSARSVLPKRARKIDGWSQRSINIFAGTLRPQTDEDGRFELEQHVIAGIEYEVTVDGGPQVGRVSAKTETILPGKTADVGDLIPQIVVESPQADPFGG